MSRSATASGPDEDGLVYRSSVWRRAFLQAPQSNGDVALCCSWRRFHQKGVIELNPGPISRGRLAPTGSGRSRVLPVNGRPGCRRSDIYNHETHNLAMKVGKHLILGRQFVQRKAKRASLPGLATFLRPREEGPALTSGRLKMLHPKLDRPILPGQHLGARDDEIYLNGKRHNFVHRESPSLPMPFRPSLDCRTSPICQS